MDQYKNLINGDWRASNETTANINPSDTSDVIGHYARASVQDTKDAISAAKEAFKDWSMTSPEVRSDILDRVGDEILARKDELGRLLSREEGKTLAEGIGESARAGRIFKFFAAEALRITGDSISSVRPGVQVTIDREPLGVVGIISPWNFPIAIPAWKIAPALAYGNCVVFKPADLVPGCGWALSDILQRSGIPAGVFNLVMGRGRVVGEEILTNKNVTGISFTGSVDVGNHVATMAVARMAKVQTEMGGKNPLVILNDADLNKAVECAVNGAYFSTGQRCTASSRLIVEAGIHDQFVSAMKARMGTLVVGDALDTKSHIGPAVSATQLQQNLNYVEIGKSEGATLAFGGEKLEILGKDGFYMQPTLFTETINKMRINAEEIFGTVATVIKAADYE
ncbi:MAG: aldehyde dehydrogenase family protein, partial [Gammaproteobacteria bacterium]|nr:aldehyde dehydrogenase family protein [Gammaproteobacteria bacterium]